MKHKFLVTTLLALLLASCQVKESTEIVISNPDSEISVISADTSNTPISVEEHQDSLNSSENSLEEIISEEIISQNDSAEVTSELLSTSEDISVLPSSETSTLPPSETSVLPSTSITPSVPSTSTAISTSVPTSSQTSQSSTSESGQFSDEKLIKYYQSVDFSKTGNDLLKQLQSLNSSKISNRPGYGGLWNYFNLTDYDPNNRSMYIAFYRGTSASESAMNKEHVWPNSHGGNLVEGDLHMTRPTLNSDNSDRGNSFYVEGKVSTTAGWDPYAAKMTEYYRGISARIIFYCVVAAPQLSLIDEESHPTTNSNRDNMMGKLSDLLKWNLDYDIDYTEINRNEGAESVQHNRNPFIDDRTLACRIWGNYNDNTRRVCSSSPVVSDPVTPESIEITPNNATVKVGKTVTLSATLAPRNAIGSVTWKSNNSDIASVDEKGVVTGLSEGEATIVATSTEDDSVYATATITVKDASNMQEETVEMSTFSSISGFIDGDENVSYLAEKGNAGTAPAVNSGQIRVYQNGGLFTVTANNSCTLSSVTLGSAMSTTIAYKIDGGAESASLALAANNTITIDNLSCKSITFICKGTTKSTRLYVNYLSVTYNS